MAGTYELPDSENIELTERLPQSGELETLKTNIKPDLTKEYSRENTKPDVKHTSETRDGQNVLFKLVCVGDFSGSWSKGVYIRDYVQSSPPLTKDTGPVLGVDFHVKFLHRRCELTETENPIRVQIWDVGEQERFSKMLRVYYKNANGAIVFWGAKCSSFKSALKWRETIKKMTDNDLPVVLLVDNVSKGGSPVSWIGDGLLMASREAMDEFCHEHEFISWFEMLSRDWTTGENSVFGQAVSRLLDEVMGHNNHKRK